MGHDQQANVAYQAIVASFHQLLSPRFILEPSRFNQQRTQDKIHQQKQMAAAFIAILDGQPYKQL